MHGNRVGRCTNPAIVIIVWRDNLTKGRGMGTGSSKCHKTMGHYL